MTPAQIAACQVRAEAYRNERMEKIIDLVTERPQNLHEVAAALNVKAVNLDRYLKPLLERGVIVKWRKPISTTARRPVVHISLNEDQPVQSAEEIIRTVRKSWDFQPVPMFAPMAYLFGRAPC